MSVQTDAAVSAGLLMAAEVYGTADRISDPVVAIWCRALAGFQPEQIRAAFDAHITDSNAGRFMPRPADIIGRIQNSGLSLEEAKQQAERAWSNVRYAIQRHGAWRQIQFADAAIAPAILAMGGWGVVCNADRVDELRKSFLAHYDPAVTEPGRAIGFNSPGEPVAWVGYDATPLVAVRSPEAIEDPDAPLPGSVAQIGSKILGR